MSRDDDGGARHTRAMVDGTASPMALLDPTGLIVEVNLAWRLFAEQGGADGSCCGVGADYLRVCDDAAGRGDLDGQVVAAGLRDVLAGRAAAFTHDYPCHAPGGDSRWFQLTASATARADGATTSGGQVGVVVVHADVTARMVSERANVLRARQDQLTGLANRLRIQEVLALELARCSSASPLTLAFLDVDLFKHVNDSLGHGVGDLLLVELARRLQAAVSADALVGRLGGDEFVVLAPGCGPVQAESVASDLRAALSDPFQVAGTYLPLTVSIGLATATDPRAPAGDLLRDADTALYAAKDAGRDRHETYSPGLHERATERLAVLVGLRRALRSSELCVQYQPVVTLGTGAVTGYEALVRWRDPVRGLQSPGSFIPLAEESGLIVPMTRWLLGEVAGQAARWAEQGFRGKTGVNISRVHLTVGTLVDDVLEALAVARLHPACFLVEITESAVASDVDAAVAQLSALREHGVAVAIDDFGSGYSSLGQLALLPADVLKLDRSLLPAGDGSARSARSEAVARAAAGLGTQLGMLVLAEGVETPAELAMTQRLGCHLAQGYLLGRPASPADLPEPRDVGLGPGLVRRREEL